MPLKIIHFDLGANMAYAHNCCGDVVIADHFVAKGTRQNRAMETLLWLNERYQSMKKAGTLPDATHYERPFARGMHATRSLWGVAGLIEAVSKSYGIDTFDSSPAEIKKFATQVGGANKDDMWSAAMGMGYMGTNEHEADAWCGLKYAERYLT